MLKRNSNTISYTLTISYADTLTNVEAKPYDETKEYEESKYYVAIADTFDGLLYVSEIPINDIEALALLTTSRYVQSAHKGDNKMFVVSLYTPSGYDAFLMACEAGTILGEPGAIHHYARIHGYFDHYHPGMTYIDSYKPHVFYGNPYQGD